MIDEACRKVGDINGESYYARSWMVLSTMTLNGAVVKAGESVRGDGKSTTSSTSSPDTSSTSSTTGSTVSVLQPAAA